MKQLIRTSFSFVLCVSVCLSATFVLGQPPYYVHKDRVLANEKAAILKVLPDKAFAIPKKKRTLLIYDVNASYGGHGAITYANYALDQMGKKTGAFTIERINDKSVFQWESLKRFDAIFINNVVGTPFDDPELLANIARFVKEGGGLMGVHGTTAAFLSWNRGPQVDCFPEFHDMIGGSGAYHRASTERVWVKVDEPSHPLATMFPAEGFEWSDEFFRFPTKHYTRSKLRVLLSIDAAKTDLTDPKRKPERTDGDYGIAWIQSYGKGRVFYCSLAHNPKVFFDAPFLKFYLGATQYVLGDFDVPDSPVKK